MGNFEIKASDTQDSNNNGNTGADVAARFPGVVVFYRSESQCNNLFGSDETDYDGSFGFDTYLPCLQGRRSFIQGKYEGGGGNTDDSSIKTRFPISTDNSTEGVPQEICLYPPIDKLEQDTQIESYNTQVESQYKIPYLFMPKDKREVTIYCKILFPDPDKVNVNYKKAMQGKTEQDVKFKFVKIDDDFVPQREQIEKTENGVSVLVDGPKYQGSDLGFSADTSTIQFGITSGNSDALSLTITKGSSESDNKVALIAYCEEKEGDEIKEYRIGQLNIYSNIYDKSSATFYTDGERSSCDIKFVRVFFTANQIRRNPETKVSQTENIRVTPEWMHLSDRQREGGAADSCDYD